MALDEYRRRLFTTHRACSVLQGGPIHAQRKRTFCLYEADARRLPDGLGEGADLAVMGFCVSQVLDGPAAAVPFVRSLLRDRRIPRLAIIAHDHAIMPDANEDDDDGVDIQALADASPPQPTRTGVHGRPVGPWRWCPLDHVHDPGSCGRAVRLRTRLAGTTLAADVVEHAFDAEAFVRELRRSGPHMAWRIHLRRPFHHDAQPRHWLLRSLVLITVTADINGPAGSPETRGPPSSSAAAGGERQ